MGTASPYTYWQMALSSGERTLFWPVSTRQIAGYCLRGIVDPVAISVMRPAFRKVSACGVKAFIAKLCNEIYYVEILLVNSVLKACISKITLLDWRYELSPRERAGHGADTA